MKASSILLIKNDKSKGESPWNERDDRSSLRERKCPTRDESRNVYL